MASKKRRKFSTIFTSILKIRKAAISFLGNLMKYSFYIFIFCPKIFHNRIMKLFSHLITNIYNYYVLISNFARKNPHTTKNKPIFFIIATTIVYLKKIFFFKEWKIKDEALTTWSKHFFTTKINEVLRTKQNNYILQKKKKI